MFLDKISRSKCAGQKVDVTRDAHGKWFQGRKAPTGAGHEIEREGDG